MPSRPGAEAGPHGPVRVTLVLDVAAVGGAETVLRNTFGHLDPRRVVTDVVCLREAGPLADDFRAVTDGVTTLPRGGRSTARGSAASRGSSPTSGAAAPTSSSSRTTTARR